MNQKFHILLAVVALILAIVGCGSLFTGRFAHALSIPTMSFLVENQVVGGGDCSADFHRGDVHLTLDNFCDYRLGRDITNIVMSPKRENKNPPVPTSTDLPVSLPTIEVTIAPPTETEVVNTPTTIETPAPPVVTEVPTQNPTEVSQPPSNPPTTDVPEVCKNKNSGRDGTPAECNAGGGQEKK